MRVISGSARGRTLKAVPGDSTRPILDRVKTALFDTLRPEIQGARVYDMFAGAGSIGIEALSQGAAHCVFVDIVPAAAKTIKENLEGCKLADKAEVRQTDTFLYLEKTDREFDIVFVAPPQYKGLWSQALMRIAGKPQVVAPGGLVVVQIDPSENDNMTFSEFKLDDDRTYGRTELLFFRKSAPNR